MAKALIIGSGPNGLAAAVVLSRLKCEVTVMEASLTLGGGLRSQALTLPGYTHDTCAAIPSQIMLSEFFQKFEIEKRVQFINPEISYAHPLEGCKPALAFHSLARTTEYLEEDGVRWKKIFSPLVDRLQELYNFSFGSLLSFPPAPLTTARFALRALIGSYEPTMKRQFIQEQAPALIVGCAAHSISKLPSLSSSGAGLLLAAMAHGEAGWPLPVGGAQAITDAMVTDIASHGGHFELNAPVNDLRAYADFDIIIVNGTPREFLKITKGVLPPAYRKQLDNFRYGNGISKIDLAVSEPVPWKDKELYRTAVVHLGGTAAEVRAAENMVARGQHPARPFVLLTQPTLFDPGRAPCSKHIVWAYTHVPHNSSHDMSEAIVSQIERFAPGFRDTILAMHRSTAKDVEGENRNFIGGDISAGSLNMLQLVKRPTFSNRPWATPLKGVYLASGSTAPGPSIHGLSGYRAALLAARCELGITAEPYLGIN